MATINGRHIPWGVLQKTLEHLDSESLFIAGQVSRELREVASDHQLWSKPKPRKSWSPEFCGSLRTVADGKDIRMLYRRWHHGKPVDDFLLRSAHGDRERRLKAVKGINLSQAGALVAWSLGFDGELLWTDTTTCKTHKCRVFIGGKDFVWWDPRQSSEPIFNKDYFGASQRSSSFVTALMSVESTGQPSVLTAGNRGEVCLWDLRQTKELVRKFTQQGHWSFGTQFGTQCMAFEPRHRTVIGGGASGLVFWNFDTGEAWATPPVDALPPRMNAEVKSIAVGTERMIVAGMKAVSEWAIPDPNVDVPRQLQGVLALPTSVVAGTVLPNGRIMPYGRCVETHSMQGVGEGPAGILAGTGDGSIGMWKCLNNRELAQRYHEWCDYYELPRLYFDVYGRPFYMQPLQSPIIASEQLQAPVVWPLQPRLDWLKPDPNWAVSCLAATDEVVVNGFCNGKIRIVQMKEFQAGGQGH